MRTLQVVGKRVEVVIVILPDDQIGDKLHRTFINRDYEEVCKNR